MRLPSDLGGIDGAIVECNERARAAGLIGFYRPWLATTSVPSASVTVGNSTSAVESML